MEGAGFPGESVPLRWNIEKLGDSDSLPGADKSNYAAACLWSDWDTALLNTLVQQGYNEHTETNWGKVSLELRTLSGTVRTTTEVFAHFCKRNPEYLCPSSSLEPASQPPPPQSIPYLQTAAEGWAAGRVPFCRRTAPATTPPAMSHGRQFRTIQEMVDEHRQAAAAAPKMGTLVSVTGHDALLGPG